jgi:hypothetical protein
MNSLISVFLKNRNAAAPQDFSSSGRQLACLVAVRKHHPARRKNRATKTPVPFACALRKQLRAGNFAPLSPVALAKGKIYPNGKICLERLPA